MAQKKIVGKLKLQIPAGKASPAPPIGPALGQRGLNIMEFCKTFNANSKSQEQGVPLPVDVTIYADKSYDMKIKSPPVSHFLRKMAKLDKGGSLPGREVSGSITLKQCREIAEKKIDDLNTTNVDSAVNIIIGSARAMGLEVKN
jgi:large subunit ribosomal protein L11